VSVRGDVMGQGTSNEMVRGNNVVRCDALEDHHEFQCEGLGDQHECSM